MKSHQQMCNCMDIYKRCFSWRKCVQTVGAFLENNVTNSDDRAIVLMHSTLLINVNLCDIGKVRKQFFLRMIKAILRINKKKYIK